MPMTMMAAPPKRSTLSKLAWMDGMAETPEGNVAA
jgi:hypothetical protein